ncbi:hypothetical protein BT63DRAFT_422965 [Microthyrium microscopicum]|uniref:Uncharacterized protein n=1 Tax=Microthyrium microscopicum TaxID=703497 RepID=A0A6A6ULG4_9PEZI|nr:hypothetical protein BT63DRAFT_422965 [Microthyrium microscopicum]
MLNPTTITLLLISLALLPAFFVKSDPLVAWLKRKRYQYEVTVPLYMLTPTEQFIFNSLLFLCLAIMFIAAGLYLPDHIMKISGRVYYYVNGDS